MTCQTMSEMSSYFLSHLVILSRNVLRASGMPDQLHGDVAIQLGILMNASNHTDTVRDRVCAIVRFDAVYE